MIQLSYQKRQQNILMPKCFSNIRMWILGMTQTNESSDSEEPGAIPDTDRETRFIVHQHQRKLTTNAEILKCSYVEVEVDGLWYCARVIRERSSGDIRLEDKKTGVKYHRSTKEYSFRTCPHHWWPVKSSVPQQGRTHQTEGEHYLD